MLTPGLPVRSASFILLQGVPPTISLERVRESILEVDGVLSLHELHVWQLSETKIVASVHVLASRNHDFMPIASKIRKALHHHGIHSSTIQPEYKPTYAQALNVTRSFLCTRCIPQLLIHFICRPRRRRPASSCAPQTRNATRKTMPVAVSFNSPMSLKVQPYSIKPLSTAPPPATV